MCLFLPYDGVCSVLTIQDFPYILLIPGLSFIYSRILKTDLSHTYALPVIILYT